MQTTLPEPENRYPNCLFMKLHVAVAHTSETSKIVVLNSCIPKSKENEQIDLKLTVRFGEEEIKVLGGSIRFVLRRGKLKLRLGNCKIPLETTEELLTPFTTAIEKEVQQGKNRELQGGASIAVTGGFSTTTKDTTTESIKTKYYVGQIRGGGTEEEPTWEFIGRTDTQILEGFLKEKKLGELIISETPCFVEAIFHITRQTDIFLTEASGVWTKNIGRNKTAILERKLFLQYIQPKLQPYISRAEVRYE